MHDPAAQCRRLWSLLGDLPPPPERPDGERLGCEEHVDRVVEGWRLALAADEPAPAVLVLPTDRPRGVVLYHHAHGHRSDIGMRELLEGRPMLIDPPYAIELARLGFAALAIDHRGFGERALVPERMLVKRGLWEGVPLWGRRVADSLAATAWLRGHPALRELPIVALGFSMGGTLAWWSAALDTRIAAVVDACCLAEFDALLADGSYDRHAEYYFVPGLQREFTAAAINALVLPRPHLSLVGRDDPITPPAGISTIDAAMRSAAVAAGVPTAWRQSVHATGHQETRRMREDILHFLGTIAR